MSIAMNRSRSIRRFLLRVAVIRRAAGLCRPVALGAALALLASCGDDNVGPEDPLTYQVVTGACGKVVFIEKVGGDLESALAVVEARIGESHAAGDVKLELTRLEVADGRGASPAGEFYLVLVLDPDTEELLYSASDVVTTGGDLFRLQWCPD